MKVKFLSIGAALGLSAIGVLVSQLPTSAQIQRTRVENGIRITTNEEEKIQAITLEEQASNKSHKGLSLRFEGCSDTTSQWVAGGDTIRCDFTVVNIGTAARTVSLKNSMFIDSSGNQVRSALSYWRGTRKENIKIPTNVSVGGYFIYHAPPQGNIQYLEFSFFQYEQYGNTTFVLQG